MRGAIVRIHACLAHPRAWAEPASRALIVGLLYYVAAAVALNAFATHWRMGDSYVASVFSETIASNNPRPFVYRVLTPFVIRTVSAAIPSEAEPALTSRSEMIRARYGTERGPDVEYAVAYYLLFACLVGSMLAWRSSIAEVIGGRSWIRDLAPVLVMLLYPMSFMRGGYIYDAPAMFLSSACFLAFLRRRWWLFYGLFALAVLNKESEIVLAVWLLAAYFDDRDLRSLVKRGLLCGAIAVPLIVAVRLAFAGHSGPPYQFNLQKNIEFLLTPGSYTMFFDVYAGALMVPLGLNLLNLAILTSVLLVTYDRVPALAVRAFFLTAAAIAPLWLLFGYQDELRVFAAVSAPWAVLIGGWLRLLDRSQPRSYSVP